MSKKKGVQIVAIVEDRELERFVRKTLKSLGFDKHKVDVRQDYPRGGAGSGKQYVENTYEKEIVTFRQKSRENRGLLIGTDADQQTVAQRIQVLEANTNPSRGPLERIVYWIPKWHVETWGLHLNGNEVDEDSNYHSRKQEIDWDQAGVAFTDAYNRSKREAVDTLDSLSKAYTETRRIGD